MRKTQICSRGHDKDVIGRDSSGWCLECKRIRGKEYHETYDASSLLKVQFCVHGHDTFITGRFKKNGACKECGRISNREAYYDNVEEIIKKNRAWAVSNPEKVKKIKKKWSKRNPNKTENSRLLYKHGISSDDYNKLFKKQRGKCAICGLHRRKFKRAFAVDHDHKTGEIRGLLCFGCNVKLGVIENKIFVKKATKYLKGYLI